VNIPIDGLAASASLRVRVDRERCQGPRAASLSRPSFLRLMLSARPAKSPTVGFPLTSKTRPGSRGPTVWSSRSISSAREKLHDQARTRCRLGRRFRPSRSRLCRKPISDMGRVAAKMSDSPHRTLLGCIFPCAMRTSGASRTTRSISPRAVFSCARPATTAACAADHVGSARTPR
jgi:hypothetical protein